MFGPPQTRANMDLSQLIPASEVLDSLVEGYNCLEQLMPGYVAAAAAQGGFEGSEMFQHHSSPVDGVTGGAMPVGLVPRALHDW